MEMGNNPICTLQCGQYTESAVKAYSVKDRKLWDHANIKESIRGCTGQHSENRIYSSQFKWELF